MNNPLPPDPYKALGVEPTADASAIKLAYRKLVLRCHPDKFPDPTLKAQKQDEFQRVQQAWEILGSDDKRKEYDLEVKAKKLKEELYKRAPPSSNAGGSRYVNVNVRTAEQPPGWSPSSKHTGSKSNSHKVYNGLFSQSWENEIPSRSKYYEEGRTARRAASYEKPRRDDSRERRRRAAEDDRERRREQEDEEELERKRRKAKERELRERELKEREQREREREREKARKARDREDRERESRLREREEARLRADAKAEKKRERERAEREAKRKQEEEKARAKTKPKPYVEQGFSDDEEDTRKSPAKKTTKNHTDSPTREKPSSKQRDRTGSREEAPSEDNALGKLQSAMAYAAQYVQETKNKANKPSPKLGPDTYSAAYPDPNEKFASPAAKRRGSGDVKHGKGESNDVPGQSSKERSESAQQVPPRLQKSYTTGYMPQTQPPPAPPLPPRGHPSRAYTMQPDHFDMGGRASGDKHRSSRRRASFDEDNDYFDDRHAHQPQSRVRKYSINRDKGVTPRTVESKYNPYGPSTAGATFNKVKTAPTYGPEHVSTTKRYQSDDVLSSDYGQPSYTEYHPTQAAY